VSSKDEQSPDTVFASLVITLSSSAWIGLGKIEDPVSGGVKKNLKAAKYTIDILIMLREKTEGNLNPEEQRLLNGVIADLQANYAETVFVDKDSIQEKDTEPASEGSQSEPEEKKE
jgi:hypothetical protein